MVDSTDESEDTAVGLVDEDNLSDSSETSSSESSEVGSLPTARGRPKGNKNRRLMVSGRVKVSVYPEYMLFSQPLPQRMPCQCLLGMKWTVNFRRNLHSTL